MFTFFFIVLLLEFYGDMVLGLFTLMLLVRLLREMDSDSLLSPQRTWDWKTPWKEFCSLGLYLCGFCLDVSNQAYHHQGVALNPMEAVKLCKKKSTERCNAWMEHDFSLENSWISPPMNSYKINVDVAVCLDSKGNILDIWTQFSFYTQALYGESLTIQLACSMGQQLGIKNLKFFSLSFLPFVLFFSFVVRCFVWVEIVLTFIHLFLLL